MPFIVKSQPETLKKSSITSVSEDFHKNFSEQLLSTTAASEGKSKVKINDHAGNFVNKTPVHVVSCKFCKIFQSTSLNVSSKQVSGPLRTPILKNICERLLLSLMSS